MLWPDGVGGWWFGPGEIVYIYHLRLIPNNVRAKLVRIHSRSVLCIVIRPSIARRLRDDDGDAIAGRRFA